MEYAIDYPGLIDNAMRGVVRDVLKDVASGGLPGSHHFFISFKTAYPGVKISERMRGQYPEEITIVLQHQFWDLRVEKDYFTVTLSFNNVPETLVVPLAALTAFADPSIKFGLQFHGVTAEEGQAEALLESSVSQDLHTPADKASAPSGESETPGEKIISLDAWRKK